MISLENTARCPTDAGAASPAEVALPALGVVPDSMSFSTWIELSESNYAHNLKCIRHIVGRKVEVAAVVKANAYGHGLQQVAALAAKYGADSFCVQCLDDALALRQSGYLNDILILGHLPPSQLHEAASRRICFAAYSRESVSALLDASGRWSPRLRVHVKLETGMHRQGMSVAELRDLLAKLTKAQNVTLVGAYTHFAKSDEPGNTAYLELQLARFRSAIRTITSAGFLNIKRHAASSAATLCFPAAHFDMVRVGIAQYGLWPSESVKGYHTGQALDQPGVSLRPVATWKTRICQVKDVPAGGCLGYGCSFKTSRPSRIAVLPIGYADGYDRKLSNLGRVLVRGRRVSVVGRVCMNLVTIDVTDLPEAAVGDEVVLLGRQGNQEVSADELAALIGTINYEVVTRLSKDITRVIVPG